VVITGSGLDPVRKVNHRREGRLGRFRHGHPDRGGTGGHQGVHRLDRGHHQVGSTNRPPSTHVTDDCPPPRGPAPPPPRGLTGQRGDYRGPFWKVGVDGPRCSTGPVASGRHGRRTDGSPPSSGQITPWRCRSGCGDRPRDRRRRLALAPDKAHVRARCTGRSPSMRDWCFLALSHRALQRWSMTWLSIHMVSQCSRCSNLPRSSSWEHRWVPLLFALRSNADAAGCAPTTCRRPGRLLRWPVRVLTHPVTAIVLFNGAMVLWHPRRLRLGLLARLAMNWLMAPMSWPPAICLAGILPSHRARREARPRSGGRRRHHRVRELVVAMSLAVFSKGRLLDARGDGRPGGRPCGTSGGRPAFCGSAVTLGRAGPVLIAYRISARRAGCRPRSSGRWAGLTVGRPGAPVTVTPRSARTAILRLAGLVVLHAAQVLLPGHQVGVVGVGTLAMTARCHRPSGLGLLRLLAGAVLSGSRCHHM